VTDATPRPPTVAVAQACALVGVSRRTMYNWMATNKVDFYRLASGSRRIVTASLFRAGNIEPPP